jgi:thiol-disulfide isomerase/thioredoxin
MKRRKAMFRTSQVAGVVLMVALLGQTVSAETPKVGDAAPEIQVGAWMNSEALTLAKLQNKIVVVEFWATWCGPCVKNIPHLIELHEKYKDKGVVIMGLSDEPMSKVKGFAEKMKMTYAVGAGSRTGSIYGVRGIPHAVVVAPGGKVVWTGHPAGGLDKAIEDALKSTPPKI